LDPPKVGHQGVIKMIKVHFHSGNIRVIIFHKFGQFIPAKYHLFKVLRVRCSILILLLKTVRCSSVLCSIPHCTLKFRTCSSRCVTQVIVALMRFGVTVA
jgi:hypothetical protein